MRLQQWMGLERRDEPVVEVPRERHALRRLQAMLEQDSETVLTPAEMSPGEDPSIETTPTA